MKHNPFLLLLSSIGTWMIFAIFAPRLDSVYVLPVINLSLIFPLIVLQQ